MPAIPALRRLRQEDVFGSEANPKYTVRVRLKNKLGAVVYGCNLSMWEAETGDQEFRGRLHYIENSKLPWAT